MKLKKYSAEELDAFFDDNAIEFEELYNFLAKEQMKMNLSFDGPVLTIKLELVDM